MAPDYLPATEDRVASLRSAWRVIKPHSRSWRLRKRCEYYSLDTNTWCHKAARLRVSAPGALTWYLCCGCLPPMLDLFCRSWWPGGLGVIDVSVERLWAGFSYADYSDAVADAAD